jgi:hypothetical protein
MGPLLVMAQEYVDLARQLVSDLASSAGNAGQPTASADSLASLDKALAQMETAMARHSQLQQAAGHFRDTSVHASAIFDHALHRQAVCVTRACADAYQALCDLENAIPAVKSCCPPPQAVVEETTAVVEGKLPDPSPGAVDTDKGLVAVALRRVISVVKALVTTIMAALMMSGRPAPFTSPLARVPQLPSPASAEPPRQSATSSAVDSPRAPAAGHASLAASALGAMRTHCQNVLAALREATGGDIAGDDPRFLGNDEGNGASREADEKIRSYFALFELLKLLQDNPPPVPSTQPPVPLPPAAMTASLHTGISDELKAAIARTIALYPEKGERIPLQGFYDQAFPVSPVLAVSVPRSGAEEVSPPMPPVGGAWSARLWQLGPPMAAALLYLTLSTLA